MAPDVKKLEGQEVSCECACFTFLFRAQHLNSVQNLTSHNNCPKPSRHALLKLHPPASPFHYCCDVHNLRLFTRHNNRGTPTMRINAARDGNRWCGSGFSLNGFWHCLQQSVPGRRRLLCMLCMLRMLCACFACCACLACCACCACCHALQAHH